MKKCIVTLVVIALLFGTIGGVPITAAQDYVWVLVDVIDHDNEEGWDIVDVGSPTSSPTCSVSIEPDLSFTLEDAVYDAGPLVGKIAFQAEFKYSGEQNDALLWYLADIKVDD